MTIKQVGRIGIQVFAKPELCFAAALLIATAGCATTTPAPEQEAHSTGELEELFHARRDSALMKYSQADVDFMNGMIAHHAQALVMSRLAPTHGASDEVQTLAARIINAQKDEIETMQRWLEDRDLDAPTIHIDGLELTVHGAGDHAMHMPGMLTQEQLEELDSARGGEFDRLFLKYMIQHHSGAVTMVENLFAKDGAAQGEATYKLASDIQVDQRTEIARMERMLEARKAD